MTISFSGLASGLDTSQWVESLVALKQAKVETMKEEKENVLLSKETLDSIKSFFNSFRNVLEKVTDAHFGPNMDLFVQNLAVSTNVSAITANATTEAEEAKYNILVDRLATETKVNSNYSYMTTIVQTTTATNDSLLSHLGVKSGNIGVTVKGVEHNITLEDKDTIGSFANKLNGIGVEASFNETTGIFSVNLNAGDIRDIDSTGIVNALHLTGVNEGYESDALKVSNTDTVYSAATSSTKLKELGVNSGTLTVHANNSDYQFVINDNTTLGDFISQLNSKNIEAELDNTGVFTLTDAEITDEGTTNILDALGLSVDIYGKTQKSNKINYTTVVTQSTSATSSTLLKDLGVSISDNQTVIVKNSSNKTTTITVGTSTTLGGLLNKMTNAGLYAELNEDGVVEITGGTITGGTFDAIEALGLKQEPYTAMVTGDPLTETVTTHKIVDLQTKLVDDLGIKEGYLEVMTPDKTKYYEKIYSGQTIADFMADMGNLGINTKLDEESGVLTITGGAFDTLSDADVQALVANGTIRETDSRYIKGTNLLECLYGASAIPADKVSISSTRAQSRALTYSVTDELQATRNTTFEQMGFADNNASLEFTVRGDVRTVNISKTDSIDTFINKLANQGIEAHWDDDMSKLTINNAHLTKDVSGVNTILNLETSISGKYITSDALYSNETITIDATRDTQLRDYGISSSMSAADRTIKLYDSDGNVLRTTVVEEGTTIGNLLDWINSGGDVSGSLNNGILMIRNGYLENAALEAAMGLETSNKSSYVLGSVMSITTTAAVTGETTLGSIISTLGTNSEVAGGYTFKFNDTDIAVDASTTLNELIDSIYEHGGTASLDVTGRLSIEGGTVSGTVAKALGITSTTHTSAVQATGEVLYTTTREWADLSTRLGDIGVNSTNGTLYVRDELSNIVSTLNFSTTDMLADVMTSLKNEGLDMTVSDGVIRITSPDGKYVDGALADVFGIETRTAVSTINTSHSSTLSVTHTGTVLASLNTTLGEIGAITGSSDSIIIYNEAQEAIGTISNLTTSSTIRDMFEELNAHNILGEIHDGVISLYSPEGNYAAGSIMTNLGIGVESGISKTFTIAQTITSSSRITYTQNVAITEDTNIVSWMVNHPDYPNYGSNLDMTIKQLTTDGTLQVLGTINNSTSTTFGELFNDIRSYGVGVELYDGVITFNSDNIIIEGDITKYLGIDSIITEGNNTVGITKTTDQLWCKKEYVAQMGDMVSDFTGISDFTLTVMDGSTEVGTVFVDPNQTFRGMFDDLNALGVKATLSDGVITLSSNKGYYVTGGEPLGITATVTTTTITTTEGTSVTSTLPVSITQTIFADYDTKLSELGYNDSDFIYIENDNSDIVLGTVEHTKDMTIRDLFSALAAYGVSGTIQNGVITLEGSNYAYGSLLTSMGIGITTHTFTVTTSASSTDKLTYNEYNTITVNSTLKDAGWGSSSSVVTIRGTAVSEYHTGEYIGDFTLNSDDTFSTFFTKLAMYGIEAHMSGGVITLSSSNDSYADGELINFFGLTASCRGYEIHTVGRDCTGGTITVSTVRTETSVVDVTKTVTTTSTVVVTEPVIGTQVVTVVSKGTTSDLLYVEYECEPTWSNVTPDGHIDDIVSVAAHAIGHAKDQQIESGVFRLKVVDTNGYNVISTKDFGKDATMPEIISEMEKYGYEVSLSVDGVYTIKKRQGDAYPYELYFQTRYTLNDGSTAGYYGAGDTLTSDDSGCYIAALFGGTENPGDPDHAEYVNTTVITRGTITIECTDTQPVTVTVVGTGTYETQSLSITTTTATTRMTSDTTFAQLGGGRSLTLRNCNSGVTKTLSFSDTDTVENMLLALAANGIEATVNRGVLTIKFSGSDWYMHEADGANTSFATTFNLSMGQNQSYTTGPEYYFANGSGSYAQSKTQTVTCDGTTNIYRLTENYGTINFIYKDQEVNLQVSPGLTFNELFSKLAAYGIGGSIVEGRVSLDFSNNDVTFDSISQDLATSFKLSYATDTRSMTSNTASDTQSYEKEVFLNESMTFGELGCTDDMITITDKTSAEHDFTIGTGRETIGEFMNFLRVNGMDCFIQDGKMTIRGNENAYLTNAVTSEALDALNLFGNTSQYYYTIDEEVVEGTNSISARQVYEKEFVIDDSTTIAQMESYYASSGISMLGNFGIHASDGNNYNIAVTPDKTVGSILRELASLGIFATLSEGYVTLAPTDGAYIHSVFGTPLGLSGDFYTVSTITTAVDMTSSDRQTYDTVKAMTTDTTFGRLGSTGFKYVTVVSDGTEHVVTVTMTHTVDDLISTLAGYGISGSVLDGKLTFTGGKSHYIKDMSDVLKDILKLQAGEGNSWTTQEGATWVNTNSDKQESVKNDIKLTGDTVLSSINGYNNGNGSLIVHKTDGTFATISVNSSSTLDDFFRQIAVFGLSGSVDSDGKVTILGIGNVYLESAAGGTNILSSLNMGNVIRNVKTLTVNTTSDVLAHDITVAASGTTTLGNLEDTYGNKITFNASNNAELILETYSDAGNNRYTLSFNKSQSIYDVIDKLAEYGINARIDTNGRFSVESSTLNDFDMSGALGTFLMGSYTKEYGVDTTHNVSTNLVERTIVHMTDSSLLTDFGVTNGDFLLTQQGVNYTLNIDTTNIKTVGDFRNLLAQYGFSTFIDDAGRLSVSGIGDSSLSTLPGGSNIIDRFGLTDWTRGEITQMSDRLTDEEVLTNTVSMSDKLSELTNSAGVNLGITDGNIYVYHNGTRTKFEINTDDTLETLAAKLSQYGISIGLSQDGTLYFDGDENSYLTTDGIITSDASNILNKLNINGRDWNTRYNSTSDVLTYEVTSDKKLEGSTLISELQDTDGNNLGITTGSYYVYSNGVRNTETITADTTVNDLMATFAKYGLVTDINENGQITIGAYNDTYLATSALASDNSNLVETLFAQWDFVNVYTSNGLDIPTDEIRAINSSTKLSAINEGTYKEGYITVVKDGVQTDIQLTADDTVGTLMDELKLYGFESVINDNGQLIIKNTGNSLLQKYSDNTQASNALELLGIGLNDWINTNAYESKTLEVVQTSTINAAANRDTLLSDLGVTTGEYNVYNDGVKYTALISSDETLGSLMDTLKSFGLETSLVETDTGTILSVAGKGNSYVAKSNSTTNASNVVDVLFPNTNDTQTNEYKGLEQTSTLVTTYTDATKETLLSYYDKAGSLSKGDLSVVVDGKTNVIKIGDDETIGSLLDKFQKLGIEATLTDGTIMLQSGYSTLTIASAGTTSKLQDNINLVYHNDLGGYAASDNTVLATTSNVEEKTLSVASYADMNTKLGDLNISAGKLSVYRNGQKVTVDISENDTFSNLQSRIAYAFGSGVSDFAIKFENGYLEFYSTDGNNIEVGATTDTTNFSAITGIAADGNGAAKSSRALYSVNAATKLTDSKTVAGGDEWTPFRRGKVTEGTFIVGDATFTIGADTTLDDIIRQINADERANATAFWDNIEGKLVIKSRTTGSAFVNIEAGTSNFTDILGYTTSEWDAGALKVTRMNVDTQEVGENARVQINGTTYTSTSNTIASDISRIKGLTINLKGLTEGSAVTLSVERDKETLVNALSDVVDAYNELMKNVDDAIAADGSLHKETTLKMIRNQLRNLTTSSDAGALTFKNLASIGISVAAASGNNISVTNESIVNLTLNKDKFLQAFEADQKAVKELLIGGTNNTGIFTKLETMVESALTPVSGFFAVTDNSYTKKADRIEKKIVKANKDIEKYRAKLISKFSAMDKLIASFQQQYSTFLQN